MTDARRTDFNTKFKQSRERERKLSGAKFLTKNLWVKEHYENAHSKNTQPKKDPKTRENMKKTLKGEGGKKHKSTQQTHKDKGEHGTKIHQGGRVNEGQVQLIKYINVTREVGKEMRPR